LTGFDGGRGAKIRGRHAAHLLFALSPLGELTVLGTRGIHEDLELRPHASADLEHGGCAAHRLDVRAHASQIFEFRGKPAQPPRRSVAHQGDRGRP